MNSGLILAKFLNPDKKLNLTLKRKQKLNASLGHSQMSRVEYKRDRKHSLNKTTIVKKGKMKKHTQASPPAFSNRKKIKFVIPDDEKR